MTVDRGHNPPLSRRSGTGGAIGTQPSVTTRAAGRSHRHDPAHVRNPGSANPRNTLRRDALVENSAAAAGSTVILDLHRHNRFLHLSFS
jgi:hypothetical protein